MYLIIHSSAAFADNHCHAVIFSGGAEMKSNYPVHVTQMSAFYESLLSRGCRPEDIIVLEASGNLRAKDYADSNGGEAIVNANQGNFSFLRKGTLVLPATRLGLEKALSVVSKKTRDGGKVFVTFLDHGNRDGIVPWKEPAISPNEFSKMLDKMPAKTTSKIWTECCLCGSFNQMLNPNSCVATSTDADHVGDYNYHWYFPLLGADSSYAIKNTFATSLAENPRLSFEKLSRISQLENSNEAYTSKSLVDKAENGGAIIDYGKCHLGPRNSAEAYVFKIIGLPNRSICYDKLSEIFASRLKPFRKGLSCTAPSSLSPIDAIAPLLRLTESLPLTANLKILGEQLTSVESKIKTFPEFRELQEMDRLFAKQSRAIQFKTGFLLQQKALKLKDSLYRKINQDFGEILETSWQTVLGAVFDKEANPLQKRKLKEIQKCLDSPIF